MSDTKQVSKPLPLNDAGISLDKAGCMYYRQVFDCQGCLDKGIFSTCPIKSTG